MQKYPIALQLTTPHSTHNSLKNTMVLSFIDKSLQVCLPFHDRKLNRNNMKIKNETIRKLRSYKER